MAKILVMCVILVMTGCVTSSRYKRDLNRVEGECNETVLSLKARYQESMAEKDARLRSFNQLNPDGSLR